MSSILSFSIFILTRNKTGEPLHFSARSKPRAYAPELPVTAELARRGKFGLNLPQFRGRDVAPFGSGASEKEKAVRPRDAAIGRSGQARSRAQKRSVSGSTVTEHMG